MENYRNCYEIGWNLLLEAGIEEAALEARLLLEWVCGTDRNTLLAGIFRASGWRWHSETSVKNKPKEA